VEAAIAAWSPSAAWLGGGTNLLDLMKIAVARPERIIDLSCVAGLDSIEELPNRDFRIGAMVRNSDLAWDGRILNTFPMIAEAILSGASGQLRNAATVGGNIMQKTRCAYFQDAFSACNRRLPGAGCDAIGGADTSMAVLGWNDACIAPPSRPITILPVSCMRSTSRRPSRKVR
jgi:xanthine dehydrogenase YagS FAD-binding subunit